MYLCDAMRIYRSIQEFSAQNPVVTIGMFDGVHAGHRAILRQLEAAKREIGGESVLLTFWPHPRIYFGKTDGFGLLTTLDEKMELLEQAGLDVCVILPFSQDFAELTPEAYITTILHEGFGAKKVVIGYDHKYGRNGSGTFEMMQEFGEKLGFEVEQISAFSIDTKTISSTKIRNQLSMGNIETANKYLSYRYFLNGTVVAGQQIGRTIGFPTANLQIDAFKEIPASGVYAGYATVDGKQYKAVVNIGNNPTVRNTDESSIEVHLIDFQGDLYQSHVRLSFVKRLRDEQRFCNLEELKHAIAHDVEAARLCDC